MDSDPDANRVLKKYEKSVSLDIYNTVRIISLTYLRKYVQHATR